METGYLSLILHAHLPFVRHPEYEDFLEEDWLFEAISETYIPLLQAFKTLRSEGVKFRIAMSLTPPLCEMLVDPLLLERYSRRLDSLCELSEKEVERTAREAPEFNAAARMYLNHFNECRTIFEKEYDRHILEGFRDLQNGGYLEIMTCCATHGFLPLMSNDEVKRAQIQIARTNYIKHFGRPPRGIWLAECAFAPGDDRLLREAGLEFFISDAHAILYGTPRPRRGIYAPVITPEGIAVFARDTETSEQVWSSEIGYPGDPDYREFYRDLGYDGEYEYMKRYLHSDAVRRNVGIKYHRITGKVELHLKAPYVPEWANNRAAEHAGNFLSNRQSQARKLNENLGRRPIVIAPYDAELFGHWWFEGPRFLYYLFKKLHHDQEEIQAIAPLDYLGIYKENQQQTPSASSWGAEGYNRVWINHQTDWMYLHQQVAERRMVELVERFPSVDGILQRALNQAARELLLAQSSDWAFIITTGTMVQYAVKRFKDHIHRFTHLYEMISSQVIDDVWLHDVESRDSIFQEIDYRVYTPQVTQAE